MIRTALELLLITCFASFLFELAGITDSLWHFFKLKTKQLWYIPYKLLTCGKCMSFHIGWIYCYATGYPFYLSVALGCICGILSIYICKYAYSSSIR